MSRTRDEQRWRVQRALKDLPQGELRRELHERCAAALMDVHDVAGQHDPLDARHEVYDAVEKIDGWLRQVLKTDS